MVTLEDDGLFSMAAYSLGIAHPPGYPVHTFLGKLFTLLPFGTIAFRLHLLSAVLGALTCCVLSLILIRLQLSRVPAVLAGLLYGCSGVFWSQSIIAEVYTLNTLFFFTLLLLVLHYREDPRPRSLISIGVVTGLSLANHWPLMILAGPAFVAFLWPVRASLPGQLPKALLGLIAGLTPYLGMWIRSRMDPAFSFYGPLESFADFWTFVSREGYAEAGAATSLADKQAWLGFLFRETLQQVTIVGALLGVIGWAILVVKGSRSLALGLLLAFLGNSVLLVFLLKLDYNFFQRAIFRVYPLVSYGILVLCAALLLRHVKAPRAIGPLVLGLLLVCTLVFQAPANQRRSYDWADAFGRLVLSQLEPNAVFFIDKDYDVPAAYLHHLQKVQPDIEIIHTGGLLFKNRLFTPFEAPAVQQRKLLEYIAQTPRPVYFAREPGFALPHGHQDAGVFVRIDRSLPAGEKVDILPPDVKAFFLAMCERPVSADPWTEIHMGDIYGKFAQGFTRMSLAGNTEAAALLEPASAHPQGMLARIYTQIQAGRVADAVRYEAWFVEQEASFMARYSQKYRGDFYYCRAHVALSQKNYDATILHLRRSIEVHPAGDNMSRYNLLEIYVGLKKFDEYRALRGRLPSDFAFANRLPGLDQRVK